MKTFPLFLILCLAALSIQAQSTFFSIKEGTQLTYKNYDKKGAESGMQRTTIRSVKQSGTDVQITYLSEVFDKKMKPVFQEEISVHQQGNMMYFDMSNFVNKSAFQQNGEIPATVSVEGNSLEVPVNAKAGDVLADGHLKITSSMGIMTMAMTADVVNRQVNGWEDITVKAGTYHCLKTSSDVNVKTMGFAVNGSSTQWYALGVGMVKTESYDSKGGVVGTTELVEVK